MNMKSIKFILCYVDNAVKGIFLQFEIQSPFVCSSMLFCF